VEVADRPRELGPLASNWRTQKEPPGVELAHKEHGTVARLKRNADLQTLVSSELRAERTGVSFIALQKAVRGCGMSALLLACAVDMASDASTLVLLVKKREDAEDGSAPPTTDLADELGKIELEFPGVQQIVVFADDTKEATSVLAAMGGDGDLTRVRSRVVCVVAVPVGHVMGAGVRARHCVPIEPFLEVEDVEDFSKAVNATEYVADQRCYPVGGVATANFVDRGKALSALVAHVRAHQSDDFRRHIHMFVLTVRRLEFEPVEAMITRIIGGLEKYPSLDLAAKVLCVMSAFERTPTSGIYSGDLPVQLRVQMNGAPVAVAQVVEWGELIDTHDNCVRVVHPTFAKLALCEWSGIPPRVDWKHECVDTVKLLTYVVERVLRPFHKLLGQHAPYVKPMLNLLCDGMRPEDEEEKATDPPLVRMLLDAAKEEESLTDKSGCCVSYLRELSTFLPASCAHSFLSQVLGVVDKGRLEVQ
jgi:hypothetical protein